MDKVITIRGEDIECDLHLLLGEFEAACELMRGEELMACDRGEDGYHPRGTWMEEGVLEHSDGEEE